MGDEAEKNDMSGDANSVQVGPCFRRVSWEAFFFSSWTTFCCLSPGIMSSSISMSDMHIRHVAHVLHLQCRYTPAPKSSDKTQLSDAWLPSIATFVKLSITLGGNCCLCLCVRIEWCVSPGVHPAVPLAFCLYISSLLQPLQEASIEYIDLDVSTMWKAMWNTAFDQYAMSWENQARAKRARIF